MNIITKEGTTFSVHYPWAKDFPATPSMSATLSYDEAGIHVHMESDETDLRAAETKHLHYVHHDSCMELFMQYDADNDERYINIEINPNGTVYSAVCYDRYRTEKITEEDIATFGIRTVIKDDGWELFYTVPVAFIQKYIPTYRHTAGTHMRGNIYKCGDLTDHPHYGCFAPIDLEKPDFHRPEFFADFVLG